MHARHAVGSTGCRELCLDVEQKNHIIVLALARLLRIPRMEATGADVHHWTHPVIRHRGLVRIIEPEPLRFVHFAKKAATFFYRSRSCFRTSFSLRSQASSLVRSEFGVVTTISTLRYCHFQRLKVESPSNRSLATCTIVRSLLAISSIVSSLNSALNSRLCLIVIRSFCCHYAIGSPLLWRDGGHRIAGKSTAIALGRVRNRSPLSPNRNRFSCFGLTSVSTLLTMAG